MRLSKKGWMILTTLVVIALIFAFYFLVYVKDKESQIIDNKMRVLTQIKGNINLLIDNEGKIRENERSGLEKEVEFRIKETASDLSGPRVGNVQRNRMTAKVKTGPLEDLKINFSKDSIVENPGGLERDRLRQSVNEILRSEFSGWTFNKKLPIPDFSWGEDSLTWLINNLVYKKAYPDLLGKELIERKDVFEFISLTFFEEEDVKALYSNFPLGRINFPKDSTLTNFTSKNIFEIDFGFGQYLVFNSLLVEQEDSQVYLTGFVNKSQYNEEKREVSVFVITIAIILVTLMILGLPLLKLRVMSNAERLGSRDVFLAGIALVVGAMVLILFFLLFTTNIFSDKQEEEGKLMALNEQLSSAFENELNNALSQLERAKNSFQPSLSEMRGLQEESLRQQYYDQDGKIDQLVFTNAWNSDIWNSNFQYFNSIFWTDALGNIKIYFSSEYNPPRIGSLKHRKYIMDIVMGKGIRYKSNSIAFESIRSVSDGNYELGLGIPSGNPDFPVLATSFSMVSLMDPILEEGYGFCLFNSEGQTLLHSETKRNLNEDFLKETGDVFNPYLLSGLDHFTSVRYMGKNHFMYLRKIPELEGYYLATFSDKAYIYSPNAIALNQTAEMQSAYLLLLFLAYLPLFFAVCKKKKLKQKIFVFYWLRPMVFSHDNHSLYDKLLSINLLVLLYLLSAVIIYSCCIYSPELLIHAIWCSGLFLLIVNFILLSRALPKKERTYTLFEDNANPTSIWVLVGIYGAFLIIGRLMIMWENFHPMQLWDIALFIFIILWLYKRYGWSLENLKSTRTIKILNLGSFGSHSYISYKLYTTSLVVLLSVVPTFIFFGINYRMEREILFKQKAVTLKAREDNWRGLKAAQFYKERNGIKQPTTDPLDGFIGHMATQKESVNSLSLHLVDKKPEKSHQRNPSNYSKFYHDSRIEFERYGINSRGFIRDADSTHSWRFNGKEVVFPASDPAQYITGNIGNLWTLFLQNWVSVALFFILLLVIIYGLISSIVHKVFGLDFKEYAEKMVLPQDYDKIAEKLIEVYTNADLRKDAYNNSFIVGINASHVYNIFHSLREWRTACFYSIEFLDLPNLIQGFNKDYDLQNYFGNSHLNFQIPIPALLKSSSNNHEPLLEALNDKHIRMDSAPIMIFIEHFEYAYDNELLNRIKLSILQRLASNPSIRVVISSEISPTKIYEFYEDSIKKAAAISSSGSEKSLENNEKINALKSVYKQWQHLLGGFYRITVPFDSNGEENMPNELKYGQYLNRINNKYLALYGGFKSNDNYILNVQETSYTYYFAIWNSLTSQERYIIYDIAHDQFVNTNNVDGIIDLLHKGILVYDHSLHLMNESFTNFILTKVDSEEALERELAYTKRGNWSTASAILMLVIISLIVFISLGKINILEDVNALLGSLAAIFALLLRVGGMFISGKSSKE